MTNTVTIHILQSYPTGRANRGEDGAPKSISFGGVTRARFSSQSQKRAQRVLAREAGAAVPGIRTKQPHLLIEKKVGELGAEERSALFDLMSTVYGAAEDDKLKTMVFLGQDEVDQLAELFNEHRSSLVEAKKKSEKQYKAALKEAAEAVRMTTTSVDVALYGRFFADQRAWDVEAATSYTHAISVSRAAASPDFFSAVDDLDGSVQHIGTHDLTAPLMYRACVLDVNQLQRNLRREDVLEEVLHWAKGYLFATPTGGEHGAFIRTLPEVTMVESRKGGLPLTYANAFIEPLFPENNQTLLELARQRLFGWPQWLEQAYGKNGDVLHRIIEEGSGVTLEAAVKEAYAHVTGQ